MSQPFDATLTFELKRSPSLIAALCAMHVGALIIVWAVPGAVVTRAALTVVVVLSFVHALLQHARLGLLSKRLPQWLKPRIVEAVEWDTAGNWSVRYAGSAQWHGCVLRERWLHPWVVILRLRSEMDARALNVLVAADAVAADAFRRLRARLRLQTVAV